MVMNYGRRDVSRIPSNTIAKLIARHCWLRYSRVDEMETRSGLAGLVEGVASEGQVGDPLDLTDQISRSVTPPAGRHIISTLRCIHLQ